jgi:hypothetical protein
MPTKKKVSGETSAEPQAQVMSTREIYRFVAFYNEKIRKTSKEEQTGIFRLIQRLMTVHGIPPEDIALALENYAADEWRKAQDIRFSKTMRAFFMPETIREWLTPKKKPVKLDPLKAVSQFTAAYVPPPAIVEEPSLDDTPSLDDL